MTDDLIKKELQAALDVWKELAEWVHNTSKPHEIGLHCAEVVRDRIKAQAAEIERLRQILVDAVEIINDQMPGEFPEWDIYAKSALGETE